MTCRSTSADGVVFKLNKIIINNKRNKVMKNLIAISLLLVLASCASMNAAWEGGKEIVTGTVDAVVGGTTTVVSAVAEDVVDATAFVIDTTAGVVESGADYVDGQTDEMQDDKESPKE